MNAENLDFFYSEHLELYDIERSDAHKTIKLKFLQDWTRGLLAAKYYIKEWTHMT